MKYLDYIFNLLSFTSDKVLNTLINFTSILLTDTYLLFLILSLTWKNIFSTCNLCFIFEIKWIQNWYETTLIQFVCLLRLNGLPPLCDLQWQEVKPVNEALNLKCFHLWQKDVNWNVHCYGFIANINIDKALKVTLVVKILLYKFHRDYIGYIP